MRVRTCCLAVLFLAVWGCDSGPIDDGSPPTWSRAGLDSIHVRELAVFEDVLYAATDRGLYRRPLGADSRWELDGLQGKQVVDVTWRDDGSMLAGIRYEGDGEGAVLYKRGSSPTAPWSPFDAGYGPEAHRTVRALTALPGARDTLFARGAINVARSVNGGRDWESIWSDWSQIGYQAPLLSVSRHDPNLVFAGGESAAFQPYLVRSPDAGDTWQAASGISTGSDNAVYSMIEHPEEPGHFLLGMEGRILRSTDGGQSWSLQYEPANYTYVFDFEVRQAGSQTIVYAAGSEGGAQATGPLTLHRTENFGAQWETITHAEGPDSTAIRTLALVEENARDRLYLGTLEGVYVYTP